MYRRQREAEEARLAAERARVPEKIEEKEAVATIKEAEHDGDSDDGSVAAAPPTQSVTNSLGQEIGKNLNVSA